MYICIFQIINQLCDRANFTNTTDDEQRPNRLTFLNDIRCHPESQKRVRRP